MDFTQEDMLDDDVMLLDVGTAVYLWIGSGCNAEEKTKAMETAQVWPDSTLLLLRTRVSPREFGALPLAQA